MDAWQSTKKQPTVQDSLLYSKISVLFLATALLKNFPCQSLPLALEVKKGHSSIPDIFPQSFNTLSVSLEIS